MYLITFLSEGKINKYKFQTCRTQGHSSFLTGRSTLWGMLKKFLPTETIMRAAAAKSLQSCPTLCDPIDSSQPGSPIPGILQARTLKWVAISFSKAWKWKVKVKSLSHVWLLVTPWTAAHQAPPSMGFSRQEYWSHSRHQRGKGHHKICQQKSEGAEEDEPYLLHKFACTRK